MLPADPLGLTANPLKRRRRVSAPHVLSLESIPTKGSLQTFYAEVQCSWLFDRKPQKQLSWVQLAGPEPDTAIWCMLDYSRTTIGDGVQLGECVELRTSATSRIVIGNRATVGDRAIVQAGELVQLGAGSRVGLGVLIMDRNHHGVGASPEVIQPVTVGQGARIGEYAVLLPGANLPEGACVPAMAVVTRKRVIEPPADPGRLMSLADELSMRQLLAFLDPVHPLPEVDDPARAVMSCRSRSNSRSNQSSPVSDLRRWSCDDKEAGDVLSNLQCDESPQARNLRLVSAYGKLENIELSKGSQFYSKPWGVPLLVACGSHRISIETGSFVHNSTQLFATGGSIKLGASCSVSWRTAIITEHQGQAGDVVIEDQVWVGAQSVLLPGTHVGIGCVVAANSIVQGEFPPFSVIAGHPAQVKGTFNPFYV